MVTTIEIKPCPVLQPFIRCFCYRDLPGFEISRPLFATHEALITFNLTEAKFGFTEPSEGNILHPERIMKSEMVITGIGSQFLGMMTGREQARVFSIYFRSTGFHRIFGVPGKLFINRLEEEAYGCSKDLEILHQQLRESKSISEMAAHSENYFIGHANMSLKTLERKFTEQVGTSPKLFSGIVRFNKAIALKMGDSSKSWTSIVHDCGYYDQMHFIKDFKTFSGSTPGAFFKYTPPVAENFTNDPEA